jgi:hypothetical protein
MSEEEFPKLESDEEILKEASGKLIRNAGNTKEKGTLVLTNKRFIFGRDSSFLFFFFKKTTPVVDVTHDQIEKIKTKGIIGKQLQVSYRENGRYEKSFFKVKDDLDEWVAKLEEVANIN